MALLEIKDLTVDFRSGDKFVRAVDHISFSVEKGRTLGIVGESGSGKSVAALAIMGLIPLPPGIIKGGRIFYARGRQEPIDLLTLGQKEIRAVRGKDISMIFQEPMVSLNPVMRCGKQVTEVIREHMHLSDREAKRRTLELFAEVMLPDPNEMFRSYPHQLSGGQRQRVMIAMAMACNPVVLIADEPTTALDVTVQKSILKLMKNLQKKYGTAIVFISHDLGVIAELADEVLVMNLGKIVEKGLVKKVFTSPEHPYTKGLMACRPPLDKRLIRLPTISDFFNNKEAAGSFISNLEIDVTERAEQHKKIYSSKPVLELKHVKTEFHGQGRFLKKTIVKAVDDVSFEVYPGETIGLVGESGCGKTTLGRTVLRLIDSSGGKVFYKGKNLFLLSHRKMKQERQFMQIIFQDPYSSLNPRMLVGSAILEPMTVFRIGKNHKERRDKTLKLLEKVGLEQDYFYRYPHELSGGQRQRICIARALAVNPEFIICDESVAALDVSVQAQVLNLLNELKKEFGFTYIFISHDLSVVKFMSDRIIVMRDGKIEESGDADTIYYHPEKEYTRKLIEAIPKGI